MTRYKLSLHLWEEKADGDQVQELGLVWGHPYPLGCTCITKHVAMGPSGAASCAVPLFCQARLIRNHIPVPQDPLQSHDQIGLISYLSWFKEVVMIWTTTTKKKIQATFLLIHSHLGDKSHSTKFFSSWDLKLGHSHFLLLSVIMENTCTLEVQGNHSNCSRTVEGERVRDKGGDVCQLQKAFFRKEN